MFLKLVYAPFPELFNVTTLLLEEGLATSSSTTALAEISNMQPISDSEDAVVFRNLISTISTILRQRSKVSDYVPTRGFHNKDGKKNKESFVSHVGAASDALKEGSSGVTFNFLHQQRAPFNSE
ncbi:hypothetical protein BGZ65_011117 [Modicella reniformis]|uniref:Uncharacterized protein n=1 Tax=Modicella reniformis TaxID=1440133 RepID=A0A9P6IMQ6_9FUNG|nr:hypothetical protein BGZ65_011117 [Modicella reniformis]